MTARVRMVIEAAVLAALLVAASFVAPHTSLLTALQIFCLLYASYALAPAFLPDHAAAPRLFLTIATMLGFQSILQTGAYYLLPSLGLATDIGTQVLTLLVFYGVGCWGPVVEGRTDEGAGEETSPLRETIHHAVRFVCYAIALIGASFVISHVHSAATTIAVRTPWGLLPSTTIPAFLLIVGALWLLVLWRKTATETWMVSSLFFITLALVTVFVYPLGFGFDGFLHRESERLLLTTGTLHPKPLYYIGQYVFTTWLARTLTLPIRAIDPFLLVGCLPLLGAALAMRRARLANAAALVLALVLLVPLKPWITTTPQSFAYLIGLSGLLLATASSTSLAFCSAIVFGVWSVAIHPLAGLPFLGATMLVFWRWLTHDRRLLRFVGSSLAVLGTALIVPLAFFLNSQHAGAQITWHTQALFSFDRLSALKDLFLSSPLRISLFADWANFVEFLSPLLLFLLALVGLRHKKTARSSTGDAQAGSLARADEASVPLPSEGEHVRVLERQDPLTNTSTFLWLTTAGLFTILVAWLMQQAATFTFLIDYERQDYTTRLVLVGQLFLLPAALQGFAFVWQRVKRGPAFIVYGFLVFAMAWQAARIYRAFPYHDATHIEHGWNVSAADEEAVRWIDRDGGAQPYTVLANQSVSAAAISALGFKRYAGDVFFYPVPTGGPLYQVFLRAESQQVTLDDIREAARLGQSERVYVVLNRYWWQADDVADRLSHLAGSTYEIGQGDVRIYRFDVRSVKNR